MSGLPESANGRRIVAAGAIFALLAVLLGAFAAHGLKAILDAYQLGIFETATRYQMYHALGLLAIGAVAQKPGPSSLWLKIASAAFITGIALFSGSLYGIALGAGKWLGVVTPLGGLAFILGWLALAIAVLKIDSPSRS